MSRLGDVLVELGPVTQDYSVSPGLSRDLRWVRAAELNALRDELIALRAIRARLPQWANAIDDDFDWSKGNTQAAIGDMLAAAIDVTGDLACERNAAGRRAGGDQR